MNKPNGSRMLRARAEVDKAVKKKSISDSAMDLFRNNNGVMPTVVQIAQHAGMGKGTVYLYFSSREEIFLDLLSEGLESWINHIDSSVSGEKYVAVDTIVEATCSYIECHSELLSLASMMNSILEKNIELEKVVSFKQNLLDHLRKVAANITSHFPELLEDKSAMIILNGYALILGLWQLSSLPDTVQKMLQEREMDILNVDFGREIRNSLKALWHGTLAEKN